MAPGECDWLAPDEHMFTNAATTDVRETPLVTAEDIEICRDAASSKRVLVKFHLHFAHASAFQENRQLTQIPDSDTETIFDAEEVAR